MDVQNNPRDIIESTAAGIRDDNVSLTTVAETDQVVEGRGQPSDAVQASPQAAEVGGISQGVGDIALDLRVLFEHSTP